jgi:hypothetical protein
MRHLLFALQLKEMPARLREQEKLRGADSPEGISTPWLARLESPESRGSRIVRKLRPCSGQAARW